MSKLTKQVPDRQLSTPDGPFTRDEVLDVLSNQRRRFVIHYLKQREGEEVTIGDLTDRVACWENDTVMDDLTTRERKRVQNALRQFHLPKMDENGIVEYDSRRGTVQLTEGARASEFYVDVVPERGIPWGKYYLALSVVCSLCLAGVWVGAFPFSLLSPLAWGVSFAAILAASALVQFYDTHYRSRLGTRDTPREVET